MKGIHRVIIQNKRIRYDFELSRNLTILRGDSATGKTTLIEMVQDYVDNGVNSSIELHCDKLCYVLEGATWRGQLTEMNDSIVFIDEGNQFVFTDEFSKMIQKTDNYYVIVSREGLPNLPYSVTEIYGIRLSGRYGGLKQSYNEFYHIYGAAGPDEEFKPEIVITEDSNAEFQFFQGVCNDNGIALKDTSVHEILEMPSDYIESSEFFSWEQFFAWLLTDKTQGTYLKYSKNQLNPALLKGSVKEAILKVMDKICF